MTSSPDDTTHDATVPDDTAHDDTTPGTVGEPVVPSAKIAVPPLPPGFVVRAALRAALDAADPADVGLVCAPAGYGKTLLLADWARTSTGADVAWVGLDRDDNDPKRLWASLIADGGLPVGARGQPPARAVAVAACRPTRSFSPNSGWRWRGCPGRLG